MKIEYKFILFIKVAGVCMNEVGYIYELEFSWMRWSVFVTLWDIYVHLYFKFSSFTSLNDTFLVQKFN